MQVIEFSAPEFEALNRQENKLFFQGKTFVKDLTFSDRIYQRTVEALRREGDDTTSCVIVRIQNSYVLWQEDKSAPLAKNAVRKQARPASHSAAPVADTAPIAAMPLEESPVPASNLIIGYSQGITLAQQSTLTPIAARLEEPPAPSRSMSRSDSMRSSAANRSTTSAQEAAPAAESHPKHPAPAELASLIAPLVEQAVEEALMRKSPLTLEQIVDTVKNTLPAATPPAQVPTTDRTAPMLSSSGDRATSPIPQSAAGDRAAAPETSTQKTPRRMYRGVPY